MPSYDFECKECGKVFTIRKSMNEKVVPACPICESTNTSRKWSATELKAQSSGCSGCSSSKGSCGGGCS